MTNRAPAELPPGVFVHPGLEPNDPRLRRLYAEADVLALPTRSDISPFVILEAMATGMPVVASAIAGIPDMVRDGETGFLMPPRDGEALAARLGALVEDGELRRRMGAAGRALVEREFERRDQRAADPRAHEGRRRRSAPAHAAAVRPWLGMRGRPGPRAGILPSTLFRGLEILTQHV